MRGPPLHLEVLPPAQAEALRLLAGPASGEGFYLAGGTAVALRLGHRRSLDFDWFRDRGIEDPVGLGSALRSRGAPVETIRTSTDTLHAKVGGVAVAFFGYRYPLLRPLATPKELGCAIASLEDLSAMKLSAIAQRGMRRDFVDLVAIGLSGIELPPMIALYREKFGLRDAGHLLAALTYFDDAERDPAPLLDSRLAWTEVKARLREWVKAFAARPAGPGSGA